MFAKYIDYYVVKQLTIKSIESNLHAITTVVFNDFSFSKSSPLYD